jgi:sugar O-acyltransferase (sialic acid O-acetyltransferase NeuD family)
MYKNGFKPLLDFIVALSGLLLLSPIFIITTIFLSIANQGKPFFFQQRPGKNGKIFKIIKFKTMNDRTDSLGQLLPDAERLTKVGVFVRRTSLDELPQLLNVLTGDMSLIGPRPLLPHYLHLYSDFENRRHEVKPGITGWAQVNGRNAISWKNKFAYDVWYVDHVSFGLDIKIFFKTLLKVIKSEGITASDSATVEPFGGEKVTLYGASGHCKVIIDILELQGVAIAAVLDDNPDLTQILNYPINRPSDEKYTQCKNVIFSIGNNIVRKNFSDKKNCTFALAIHPSAVISKNATVNEGTVVMASVVINPGTFIGKHCIINTRAVIEHDCIIADFVHISPNVSLAGNVQVMEGAHVGIGASVIQGVKIGKWSTIGAGAVILKDVPDYAVVVGNPGRIIKYNSTNE